MKKLFFFLLALAFSASIFAQNVYRSAYTIIVSTNINTTTGVFDIEVSHATAVGWPAGGVFVANDTLFTVDPTGSVVAWPVTTATAVSNETTIVSGVCALAYDPIPAGTECTVMSPGAALPNLSAATQFFAGNFMRYYQPDKQKVDLINIRPTGTDHQILRVLGDHVEPATFTTSSELSGIGIPGTPLKIAQNGATVGQLLCWNGTSWIPKSIDTTLSLAADVINSTTTAADIGLNSPTLLAGKKYKIEIFLSASAAATTTGICLGWTCTGTGTVRGLLSYTNTAAGATAGHFGLGLTENATVAGSSRAGITNGAYYVVDIEPATDIVFKPTFRSEVAASDVTIKAGSKMIVTQK